jgi:hypothetical protein
MDRLKLNEIKGVNKNGEFNKEGQIKVQGSFSKRRPRKFCHETFYNGYENLIQIQNSFE